MSAYGIQLKITAEETVNMASNNSNHTSKICTKTYKGYCTTTSRRSKGANGTISSRTQAYLAACNDHHNGKYVPRNYCAPPPKPSLPRLESVARIGSIPVIETGLDIGEKIYTKIKDSNALTKWSLTKAESSFLASLNLAIPAVNYFSGPISRIDQILCKSLDIVEQRVPSVYLPPQMIYSNAQDYVSSHFVKPVLRRADSVKQLGEAVIDSRMTAFAADTLDSALNKADIYIDKYLPPDSQDVTDSKEISDDKAAAQEECKAGRQKAVHTIQHVDRLSRKLQRRLTRRTLLEARALKEHTTEAIHVLIYVAELIAKDPKMALIKAKELWTSLSKDEPENQARPATLEQLIVMLTRESARRLVHLINFSTNGVANIPHTAARGVRMATDQFLMAADMLIKRVHLEQAKQTVLREAHVLKIRLEVLIAELQQHSKVILEQIAMFIAGNSEREKRRTPRCHLRNNHLFNANNVINGVN